MATMKLIFCLNILIGSVIARLNQTTMPPNLRVAFVADFGLSSGARDVLELVADERTDFMIMSGDFSYGDSMQENEDFMDMIDSYLGSDYPLFPTMGNHDIDIGHDQWYDSRDGYGALFWDRLVDQGLEHHCEPEYDFGVTSVCDYQGIAFTLLGVGTIAVEDTASREDFCTYADDRFSEMDSNWKICVYHKVQKLFQVGEKRDSTGYEIYEVCRKHGAIIATSHEHIYCRTKVIEEYSDNPRFGDNDGTSSGNPLVLDEYKSVNILTGTGGGKLRDADSSQTRNGWWGGWSDGEYGATICEFYIDGDINRAKCEYKTVAGKVEDMFYLETKVGSGIAQTPDEPTPDEPTPDEPTPDEPTPDEPTPDEPTPDEPTPDDPDEPDNGGRRGSGAGGLKDPDSCEDKCGRRQARIDNCGCYDECDRDKTCCDDYERICGIQLLSENSDFIKRSQHFTMKDLRQYKTVLLDNEEPVACPEDFSLPAPYEIEVVDFAFYCTPGYECLTIIRFSPTKRISGSASVDFTYMIGNPDFSERFVEHFDVCVVTDCPIEEDETFDFTFLIYMNEFDTPDLYPCCVYGPGICIHWMLPYDAPQGFIERSTECDSNEWQCDNGDCIPSRFKCDNQFDCSDDSDEDDCSQPGGSDDDIFLVGVGTFGEVDSECQDEGGKLLSIHDESTNQAAFDICQRDGGDDFDRVCLGGDTRSRQCFIGLVFRNGRPRWTDGSDFDFDSWGDGEPDDDNDVNVFMYDGASEWHDIPLGCEMYGLCKR